MVFFYVLFKQIKPGFSTHEPISATFKNTTKLQSDQMPQAYRVLEQQNRFCCLLGAGSDPSPFLLALS